MRERVQAKVDQLMADMYVWRDAPDRINTEKYSRQFTNMIMQAIDEFCQVANATNELRMLRSTVARMENSSKRLKEQLSRERAELKELRAKKKAIR